MIRPSSRACDLMVVGLPPSMRWYALMIKCQTKSRQEGQEEARGRGGDASVKQTKGGKQGAALGEESRIGL